MPDWEDNGLSDSYLKINNTRTEYQAATNNGENSGTGIYAKSSCPKYLIIS
ncbi:MAG: hypothetical protein R3B38_02160 [Patescibacteria group bacterium]